MNTATEKFHFTKEQILDEEQEVREAMKDISRFAVLYDRYYVRLFRYIYWRVESEDDAADITSQVFLKAMLNLNKYQFRGLPFASWLYRVASNEIAAGSKTNKFARVFTATPETLHLITVEIEDDVYEDKMRLVRQALGSLKMSEMELIEMRYFEQRSFSAISEITGLTENNTKVKVHRIIQKLKEQIINMRS